MTSFMNGPFFDVKRKMQRASQVAKKKFFAFKLGELPLPGFALISALRITVFPYSQDYRNTEINNQ